MKLTKFFLVLLLLLFPFGQLTKIPLAIPGIGLYFQDLVIGLLICYWFIDHLLKRKPFLRPPLRLPILVFILVAAFSLLVNISRLNSFGLLISFLYLLRWSIYAGIYFVIYELSSYQDNKLLKLLTLIGIIVVILGLLQYLIYPNLRNLYYLGWDPHQYRVFGTFLDPGFTGIILVLILMLLLCFKTLGQNLRIGVELLVFLALLLTYSRSSYLALTGGIVVLTWFEKSLKLLLIPLLLLVFIVTVSILPQPAGEGVKLERTSSISARLENYQQSLTIIKDSPLFGVGFNSLRFVKRDYGFLDEDWQESHSGAGADSSLLFVWATTGLVGLGIYLWIGLSVILNSIQNLYRFQVKPGMTKKLQLFNHLIIASTTALFIHSFFLNSLFYPWVMIWMWILLGLSHSQVEEKK